MSSTRLISLRRQNFFSNGNLNIKDFKNKLVIVMIYKNSCQYCHKVMPYFVKSAEALKSEKSIIFATIQIDGTVDGEQQCKNILKHILPDYKGFPDYAFFYDNTPLLYQVTDGDLLKTINRVKSKLNLQTRNQK